VHGLADRLARWSALARRGQVGEAAMVAQAHARRLGVGQRKAPAGAARRPQRAAATVARSVVGPAPRGAPTHRRRRLRGMDDEDGRARQREQVHSDDQQDDLTNSDHDPKPTARVTWGASEIVR
jgi:hypothetical protein